MPVLDSTISLPGGVDIPVSELRFEFSRSGGPGGQNVNKVSTRATLLFDLSNSPSLDARQKAAIRDALAGRINQHGILRVVSSKHRTQAANREAALERFVEVLTGALTPRKSRKKTGVPSHARKRRLEGKRRRSERKRQRASPELHE